MGFREILVGVCTDARYLAGLLSLASFWCWFTLIRDTGEEWGLRDGWWRLASILLAMVVTCCVWWTVKLLAFLWSKYTVRKTNVNAAKTTILAEAGLPLCVDTVIPVTDTEPEPGTSRARDTEPEPVSGRARDTERRPDGPLPTIYEEPDEIGIHGHTYSEPKVIVEQRFVDNVEYMMGFAPINVTQQSDDNAIEMQPMRQAGAGVSTETTTKADILWEMKV